ncbi:MAG: pteridine reductase [Pseudomonadota bacterium]
MTDNTLAGRWIVVTGAARRVGRAIATRLHRAGAGIVIHCRNSRDDADKLAAEFAAARPGSSLVVTADIRDPAACARLIDEAVEHAGRLDALVNNASTFYPTPLADVTEAHWDDLIGTNLKAPLFLARAAAPHLRANAGCIVNITDIHGRRPLKDHPVYGAAKAGLEMLTRSLARDLAPAIRVNGVAPGAVAWPENGLDDAARRRILERIPLGRSGSPDDIASAVLFLIADAGYVTGQILAVDGGRTLGW